MNDRERTVSALTFKKVDLIPLQPGGARKSTRERWYGEGLPAEVKPGDINEHAYRQVGGTLPWPRGGEGFPVDFRMMPWFEEAILEEKADSRIVRDWKGNVCEIGKEFTPEYLRHAIDFVTRRWIKCPVESRADWEEMRGRYDVATPARLPADAAGLGKRLAGRDWFVEISLPGPYWQLREWLGFENLSMLFIDDPEWVKEMVKFWEEYVAGVLERVLAVHRPDSVHISEDMAYKEHAMLSPAMVREFLLPTWRRWGEQLRAAGVAVYAIDSDGYVGELIPWWREAGFQANDPVEVAAGNDLVAFRRQYGTAMAYRGGIDKRAMAAGGAAIEREIERLRPVIEAGGYIPSCDHGVPADVSWDNYLRYVRLLAQATGWR